MKVERLNVREALLAGTILGIEGLIASLLIGSLWPFGVVIPVGSLYCALVIPVTR